MSVSTVITDAGFDLLRAAPGHTLIYTRAVCGSGHVETTQLAALTECSCTVKYHKKTLSN